ncbi:MAG: hypothetical protein HKN87_10205 [Saprospiraceae bacterium]|nr:hypothetical protein [Saprospiraceae bacterium]
MKKFSLVFTAILLCITTECLKSASPAMDFKINPNMYDGPYIFDEGDSLHIQYVVAGIGHDTLIAKSEASGFRIESLPFIDLQDLDYEIEKQASFKGVNKVIALSDVHGQYDIMRTLLQNHQVIDQSGTWSFGEHHLIIVGDNFDRGPKVMDILWFLFKLQKQANKAGGRVHVLLGNHEIMVLNGDLRYLHRKYLYSSAVFKTRYDQFFRKGSILGDWIADHQAMVSVNQRLFVHAGMSPTIVRMEASIEEINQIFSDSLVRQDDSGILEDSIKAAYYMEEGPLWYRGYFDTTAISFSSIDSILISLNQKNIIVGHTSQNRILPLYDSKVIVIDCSIKLGKTGQILILENDHFTVGHLDGMVTELPEQQTLFDYIYNLQGLPKLEITTDVKRIINRKGKEEYEPAILKLKDKDDLNLFTFSGKARARGEMRKNVCWFPPVKFDLSKVQLQAYGLSHIDKLKMVFRCRDRSSDDIYNAREFFLYDLYHIIDTNSIRARRVNFSLVERAKEKYSFAGFLVEDEEEYANRKNAIIVESGTIRAGALEREPFLKLIFFQYMIANTDWSIANKHNIEFVKLPGIQRVVALPYDFDYAGFVGQSYAVPHSSLPIESVHQRHFLNYKISDEEFDRMVEFYRSLESDIYKFCDEATYMDEKSRTQNKNYLGKFFNLLREPDKLKKQIAK